MTDSLSQYCPNCEAQANTIEELRSANERWVIAFNLAEERAIDAVKALQARVKVLEEALTPSAATKAAYMPEFSLTNAAVALSGKSHSPANCCALDRNQDNHGDDPRPSSTTGDRTMNEITKKALALINQVEADRGFALSWYINESDIGEEALCRAIEQHEAYKREVSDALVKRGYSTDDCDFGRFIISKPTVDPLAVALAEWEGVPNHGRGYDHDAKVLREALAKRGLKIVEIER